MTAHEFLRVPTIGCTAGFFCGLAVMGACMAWRWRADGRILADCKAAASDPWMAEVVAMCEEKQRQGGAL